MVGFNLLLPLEGHQSHFLVSSLNCVPSTSIHRRLNREGSDWVSGDFCVSGFLLSLWTERGPILVSFARLEPSQGAESGKVYCTCRVCHAPS